MYYVGNIPCTPSDIQHFGIKGMKWGVRRYQNPDGSLTAAGRSRYLTSNKVGALGAVTAAGGMAAKIAGRTIRRRANEAVAANAAKGLELGQKAYKAKKAYDTFKSATSAGTPFGFNAQTVAKTGSKLLNDLDMANTALSTWWGTQQAQRATAAAGALLSSNGSIAIGVGGAIIAGTIAYKVGKKIVEKSTQRREEKSNSRK